MSQYFHICHYYFCCSVLVSLRVNSHFNRCLAQRALTELAKVSAQLIARASVPQAIIAHLGPSALLRYECGLTSNCSYCYYLYEWWTDDDIH